MGTFYALLGQGVANWVKLTNFVLSNIGVACTISGLYMYLGRDRFARRVRPAAGRGRRLAWSAASLSSA
ncbi:hypothetical protein ACRAWD_26205 [Caulobacter segnis]